MRERRGHEFPGMGVPADGRVCMPRTQSVYAADGRV